MKAKELPVASQPSQALSASQLVHQFLLDNKIVQKVIVVDELNSWVGDGQVLHDKPLLKIVYTFQEGK